MLKYFFDKAWAELHQRFLTGCICSERHMQAELFRILYSYPDFTNDFELRIEPSIFGKGKLIEENSLSRIIPDMLVLQNNQIIAHVELKFVPNGFVQFQKDITNMVKFWKLRGKTDEIFYLKTNAKTGDWDYDHHFTIGEDFILIYALIGNEESDCITNNKTIWEQEQTGLTEIPKHLQYIGSISKDSEPKFNLD